jgi:transcriptional regulator with XRE-family HTH domain
MGVRLGELANVLSEKGWSQADLARRSGLSAHTIGRAVRDGEKVSEGSASRIARALCVRVDRLCDYSHRRLQTYPETEGGTTPVTEHIEPRHLKRAMDEKGMNPTEVASKTGLAVATVSSVLRGTRRPQSQTIEKIAGAVGADLTSRDPLSQEPVAAPPGGAELKLRAGQQGTVIYPGEETATSSSVGNGVASENMREVPDLTPVRVATESRDTGLERVREDRQDSPGALEELYSNLQQTRHMLTSLLEHVGGIEEQIRRLARSRRGEQNGSW